MQLDKVTSGYFRAPRAFKRFDLECNLAMILFAVMQASAQSEHYDLLLKGGHVIDPANHIDGVMDVAVANGRVAAVETNISANAAGKVVDATGLYVTPGLIDIHYHVGHGGAPLNWFAPEARSHDTPLGVFADLALQSGVTTVVDAGSAGADTFLLEKRRSSIRPRSVCWHS